MGRTVTIKIDAAIGGLKAKLRDAGGAFRQFSSEVDRAVKAGNFDGVADGMARVGTVGVAAFGLAVGAAAKFDKQMSAVAAATNAAGQELDMLRTAAVQAGKETSYSATEAAQAIEELSKAGVSTAQILSGGLDGALSLASAGSLDVAEAAEAAASAMTQFKLSGSDVPHIADLLAAGAGKAQGSVHDMSEALSQGGLVASQMGLSVEDTVGALAAFASAGLMGSDSGTSLKTALMMLANPTKEAKQTMEDLGIQVYDSTGNFVGLVDLAGQLQSQLGGLSTEQRNAALSTIFGSDAIRAASVLYEQGSSGIQGWIDNVNDSGYASEVAAKKTDNLIGDIERLQGSLETLAIESGSGANDGLRTLAQGANTLVDRFASLPPAVGESIVVLAGLSGGAALLAAGWVKARRSTAEFLEELRGVGPAGSRAASVLEKVTSAAGKAAVAFAVLQVADMAISATMKDLNPQIDALAIGLDRYVDSGVAAGEMARLLGGDLSKLDGQFQTIADTNNTRYNLARKLGEGMESFSSTLAKADDSLTSTKERITAVDQALAQMVQSGQADQAQAAFDMLAKQLAVNGVSMEEFKAQFPTYTAAVEVAGSASSTAANGISAVGSEADTAATKIEELKEAFDTLFNAQMDLDRATDNYKQGIRDLNKELTEDKRTLSTNSQEGLDNRDAVLDQIQNIKDLRAARLAQGDSIDEVDGKYKSELGSLKKTLIQLGYNKSAVKNLVDAYLDVPDNVSTGVTTPGLVAARKGVENYGTKLDDLRTEINTAVSVSGAEAAEQKLRDLLVLQQSLTKGISVSAASSAYNKNAYATGGWTGPGGMYDVAGVVHADEYVVRKESRQRFEDDHPGVLDYINRWGELPGVLASRGYATGGRALPGYASGGYVNVAPSSSSSSSSLSGSHLDYLDAIVAARNAVADLTRSLKENGKSFSLATQKGRDNRSALISGVRAAQAAAEAKYEETGSLKAANAVYDEYIKKLDKSLKAMGLNAKQRKKLIAEYSEQPDYDIAEKTPSNSSAHVQSVTDQIAANQALSDAKTSFAWTKPTFNVKTEAGQTELQELFSYLSAAEQAAQSLYAETGDAKKATALYNSYLASLKKVLVGSGMTSAQVDSLYKQYGRITLSKNRWGGVYERASGGLREAQIAAGGAPLYQWAEEETGGEAFIPRRGDQARSLAIWQHVGEQWLGQPVWRPGSATGGSSAARQVTVEASIPITLGTTTISQAVRMEIDTVLGEVTAATVYQTA
ncbi:phage tail tape measure protein [Actinoplanes sp. NPDC051851]|uniref:phage tail tape measure protein n=1 Tax=Actinoplanes sp. NPDC051851 TaxID=3154753 RepID=UPI0034199AE8